MLRDSSPAMTPNEPALSSDEPPVKRPRVFLSSHRDPQAPSSTTAAWILPARDRGGTEPHQVVRWRHSPGHLQAWHALVQARESS